MYVNSFTVIEVNDFLRPSHGKYSLHKTAKNHLKNRKSQICQTADNLRK